MVPISSPVSISQRRGAHNELHKHTRKKTHSGIYTPRSASYLTW